MNDTPKSLRLHITFFGRTNAGKSTFFNLFCGQDNAIVSPVPGTTTDTVEKAMELLPLGPILLTDTAGFADKGSLGSDRIAKSRQAMSRTDIAVLVITPGVFDDVELDIISELRSLKIPVLIALNLHRGTPPEENFIRQVKSLTGLEIICADAADTSRRSAVLDEFKKHFLTLAPEDFINRPQVVRDLVRPDGLCILIVPIDIQAPRGRLILPQVQTIREALDGNSCCLVVKENQYAAALKKLAVKPDLVICDSQVVRMMIENTPPDIPCTTFSIIMAAAKRDIKQLAEGSRTIFSLKDGDKVLIAESCTHHATCEDIGRVKLPALISKASGAELKFDFFSGRDFPDDLAQYALIVHCGGCMISRREFLSRLAFAGAADVPVTNYGIAISACTGVLDRVIAVFDSKKK